MSEAIPEVTRDQQQLSKTMDPNSNAGSVLGGLCPPEEIHRQVQALTEAKEAVKAIVEAGESSASTRIALFLELHYPFFNKDVQSILKERPPLANGKVQNDFCYAVDAYLWAETYALIACDKSLIKDCQFVHDRTFYFFLQDLRWFSQLISAVAAEIEEYAQDDYSSTIKPHEFRLQEWRNRYSNVKKQPSVWLRETPSIGNAKLQGLIQRLRLLTSAKHKVLTRANLQNSKSANASLRKLLRQWISSADANHKYPPELNPKLPILLHQASLTGCPELQALLRQVAVLTHTKLPAASSESAGDQGDIMNSFRVTASKINRRRRSILMYWLPSWKAELQLLDRCLQDLQG